MPAESPMRTLFRLACEFNQAPAQTGGDDDQIAKRCEMLSILEPARRDMREVEGIAKVDDLIDRLRVILTGCDGDGFVVDERGNRIGPRVFKEGTRLETVRRKLKAALRSKQKWQDPLRELREGPTENSHINQKVFATISFPHSKIPFDLVGKLQELAERHGESTKKRSRQEPMTDGQERVWVVLEGRVLRAKDIVKAILDELGEITSEETVRQHVQLLRKAGRRIAHRPGRGYFRPDAPPAEIVG